MEGREYDCNEQQVIQRVQVELLQQGVQIVFSWCSFSVSAHEAMQFLHPGKCSQDKKAITNFPDVREVRFKGINDAQE